LADTQIIIICSDRTQQIVIGLRTKDIVVSLSCYYRSKKASFALPNPTVKCDDSYSVPFSVDHIPCRCHLIQPWVTY